MATWFGDAAREPGDLDFVAPYEWDADGPEAQALFPEIASAAQSAAGAWQHGSVRVDAAGAVTEEIWTYDRVPGRRMLLPWTTPGTAGGTVQLDVVYGELLAAPAVPTALRPLGDGPAVRLPAVTPELSLAWKVMWLINDMHPQGKDLYDAVLLAGRGCPRTRCCAAHSSSRVTSCSGPAGGGGSRRSRRTRMSAGSTSSTSTRT